MNDLFDRPVGPRDDHEDDYRCTKQYQQWKENDQIVRLANMLDATIRQRIENEVTAEIASAQEFAEKSPYPAAEELYTHVYAN